MDLQKEMADLVEKSKRSSVRHYGDVKIRNMECGCRIITLVSSSEAGFTEACERHNLMKISKREKQAPGS